MSFSGRLCKLCGYCKKPARSNRQKWCAFCGHCFRPPGISRLNWRFWTEIRNAGRHNVSQGLRDSVIGGADINIVLDDRGGLQTGLIVAILEQKNDIVRFLVGRPEINLNLNLLCAARSPCWGVLKKFLSEPTINVNYQTLEPPFQGMTPLMTAVRFNIPTNVRLLLQKGADITLTDRLGNTALTMPIHHPHMRGAQNVVRAWFTRVTSVLNRWRYKTRRKRRRREKGLTRHVSIKQNLPGDIESVIKGNLHHSFGRLLF